MNDSICCICMHSIGVLYIRRNHSLHFSTHNLNQVQSDGIQLAPLNTSVARLRLSSTHLFYSFAIVLLNHKKGAKEPVLIKNHFLAGTSEFISVEKSDGFSHLSALFIGFMDSLFDAIHLCNVQYDVSPRIASEYSTHNISKSKQLECSNH